MKENLLFPKDKKKQSIRLKVLFLVAVVCFNNTVAHTQPGALDLSFKDPRANFSTLILTTSVQTDGKIIIGGDFGTLNGNVVNYLARLRTDGKRDTSFNVGSGANDFIKTTAIQADGKIIIGGAFTSYDSIASNRIMRVNTDGSPDTSFHLGTGFNDEVFKVVIQTDGKILVGGRFTSYNGNACNYLARLYTDGSFDHSFNMGAGPNNSVQDIAIQPFDDKIIIVGDFTTYAGSSMGRIARLNTDGTRDLTFSNLSTLIGASSVIYAVAIQDDGKILIGGNFQSYSAIPRNRIAQLHETGTIDSNFDPGNGFTNGEVRDIAIVNPDNDSLPNSCLVGGEFSSYNGTPLNRIALLKPNGLVEPEFDPGTGANSTIHNISRQSDGRMIIAGGYTFYNGIQKWGVARIYTCTTMQPDTITGADSVLCAGQMFTYSVTPDPVVDRYDWTLPAGWTGSSDSASITVTTNGEGGEISVVAYTDSCGYSDPQTKTIYRIQPPKVPICRVTVDELSTHNVMVWKKPVDMSLIDSFLIYRETTAGVFSKIGAVHGNALNQYQDQTANPNMTSYTYKLSVRDVCGVESALSPYHRTIHLQNLGNGNFHWSFYEIEDSTNPAVEYNIYRDNLSNGNFTQIGVVPGSNSTYTDVDYANFANSSYVVDVNWDISCATPDLNVNTTRSNTRRKTELDTMVAVRDPLMESIVVYPNPAKNFVQFRFDPSIGIRQLRVFNTFGQIVWRENRTEAGTGHTITIPVKRWQQGVYTLAIETDLGWLRQKVIIR